MEDVDRLLARAVRRLAEEREMPDFQGQIRLHCSEGRLQSFEVNERHQSRVDKTADITE